MVIYVDGSVTGNPGGVVGYGWSCPEEKQSGFGAAFSGGGSATNNVSEYIGVAAAMIWALDYVPKGKKILVRCDSELTVNQLNGLWRVKHANLKPIAAIVHMMIETLSERGVTVAAEWIPRENNRVADDLSRRAVKNQLKERYMMNQREKREKDSSHRE